MWIYLRNSGKSNAPYWSKTGQAKGRTTNMKAYQQYIRNVDPYVPGEQPHFDQMVKLNTNENPYPPSPNVLQAIAAIPLQEQRLYPDPTAHQLNAAIAKRYGLQEDQVFSGVGSDDVLALAFQTFFNSDRPIVFPQITYSFYDVWADLYKIPYEKKPLAADFHIRKEDYMGANGGVIFPNPNAPTGLLEDLSVIEEIVQANPDVVVIVDEAYIDFAGRSALELIDRYDNLIVTQTFSKARSMAGMRIGYAVSNPELIRCLNDVKYSFNSYTMNQTAIACGVEAVRDKEYFEEHVRKIIETREWAKEELHRLGFEFPDAKANFIFATHPQTDAGRLFEALKANDIYVRHWDSERIGQYLRITVGTREEMQVLFDFLTKYIKGE